MAAVTSCEYAQYVDWQKNAKARGKGWKRLHCSSRFAQSDRAIKELKQWRRRRQRERQKSNRFRLAKQQLCTCITLFCTFLSRHYTTTTRKCLISRFEEDVKTQDNDFLTLFLNFVTVFQNSNGWKNCQHLTNWTRRNKYYKVCSSATSLFKRHFLNRRCLCCLRVSIIISASSQKSCDLKVRVSVLLYRLIAFGARWARVDLAKEEFSFFFFLQKTNIVFHHISYWTRRKLKNCLVKMHKEFDLTSQTI